MSFAPPLPVIDLPLPVCGRIICPFRGLSTPIFGPPLKSFTNPATFAAHPSTPHPPRPNKPPPTTQNPPARQKTFSPRPQICLGCREIYSHRCVLTRTAGKITSHRQRFHPHRPSLILRLLIFARTAISKSRTASKNARTAHPYALARHNF